MEWARYSGGSNFGDSGDEYWALDSVIVSNVPEPSTGVIALEALVGAMLVSRKKRARRLPGRAAC